MHDGAVSILILFPVSDLLDIANHCYYCLILLWSQESISCSCVSFIIENILDKKKYKNIHAVIQAV